MFKKLSPPIRLSTPPTRTASLPPDAEDREDRDTSSHGTTATQTTDTTDGHSSTRPNADATTRTKDTSSPRLDLNTARVSLVLELTSYSMMATAKTGTLFTIYTMLDSLSAGYTPAVQSLALGIYTSRGGHETGKLFGGLSVVQVLG